MAANQLQKVLESGHREGLFRAVARIGGPSLTSMTATVGTHQPESNQPVTTETRFDLASLTKPIVTNTLVFQLLEAGKISFEEPIDTYIPGLEGTDRGAIPIHTLLTHTSGMRAYIYDTSWDTREDVLAGLEENEICLRDPGEQFEYSCLNFLYLREIMARIVDEPLTDHVQTQLFDPVGMTGASIGGVDATNVPVATTYDHEHTDQRLVGTTHDPLARAMGGYGGNAGLFATVGDVARFAEMVLADGRVLDDGKTILSPASIRSFPVERASGDGVSQGYGWRLKVDRTPSPIWSEKTIGHTGFTGTSLWIDLENEFYAILLTNAVNNPDSNLAKFRQRFHSVAAAMATSD